MTPKLDLTSLGPRRIGVVGHVGNGNLGDEAIITALIDNIRERLPGCVLVGFTMDPNDTTARHAITAFPLRRLTPSSTSGLVGAAPTPLRSTVRRQDALRAIPSLFRLLKSGQRLLARTRAALFEVPFLLRSFCRLSRISLLIIAGSHQFSDAVGGPWGFPYTVFKWTLLARLRRIPVAIVSMGAGPLRSPLSRWFVRRTVAMAAYRTYRDESSQMVVRELGFDKPGDVVGDLAFSLRPPEKGLTPISKTIAINLMPFVWQDYDTETERALYEQYAETLASFIVWLTDRHYGVTLFPTQLRLDPPVIRDVQDRVARLRGKPDDRVSEAHVDTASDILALLASARAIVATRFHGVLLGCHAGRPVLALAYHAKTRDLMAQTDQAQYALSVPGLSLEALQAVFVDLESRHASVMEQTQARLCEIRDGLGRQYERLVAIVTAPQTTATEESVSEARIA